jgi:hypothetical protein
MHNCTVDTQAKRDDLKSDIAHSGTMNNCTVDTQAQRDDLKSDIAHNGTMNICRHPSTEG